MAFDYINLCKLSTQKLRWTNQWWSHGSKRWGLVPWLLRLWFCSRTAHSKQTTDLLCNDWKDFKFYSIKLIKTCPGSSRC